MNRLTELIDDFAIPRQDIRNNGYRRCLDKLAYLEDLQEMGRLIELPCAVGDILYTSNEEYVVKELSYWEDDCDLYSLNIKIEDWKENFEMISPEDIGKTVFLTKEEAEAKLAELKAGEQE